MLPVDRLIKVVPELVNPGLNVERMPSIFKLIINKGKKIFSIILLLLHIS